MRFGVMRSNKIQIHARAGADRLLAVRLFLGALVALWVLDVLLSLGLLKAFLLHHEALGRAQDFAGLLVGELQIAIGAAVVAWFAGAAVGLVLAKSRRDREAVAFLSALIVVLVVLAKTPDWHFTSASFGRKLLVSAVTGFIAWPTVRFLMRARRVDAWGVGEIIQWALVPALVVGFANEALNQVVSGALPAAAVSGPWRVARFSLSPFSRWERARRGAVPGSGGFPSLSRSCSRPIRASASGRAVATTTAQSLRADQKIAPTSS